MVLSPVRGDGPSVGARLMVKYDHSSLEELGDQWTGDRVPFSRRIKPVHGLVVKCFRPELPWKGENAAPVFAVRLLDCFPCIGE